MNKDVAAIVEWYFRKRTPGTMADKAMELYFTQHPRLSFLKMLPLGARVADVGAGDGSLALLKDRHDPVRTDIRMHACSLEAGTHFHAYESTEIGDWNAHRPRFDGMRFDGIVCAHFIEHIDRPESLLEWACETLAPGGRAYIEWPADGSLQLPAVAELRTHGLDLMISNFHDDCTHAALPDRGRFCGAAARLGLAVEAQGEIRMPWLAEELMAHYRDAQDRFPVQAAFWLWTGWSQYVVVRKE